MASAVSTVFILIGLIAACAFGCHGGGQIPQRSVERGKPGTSEGSEPTGTPGTPTVVSNDDRIKSALKMKETLMNLLSFNALAAEMGVTPAKLTELVEHARKMENSDFVELVEAVQMTESALKEKLQGIQDMVENVNGYKEGLTSQTTLMGLAEKLPVDFDQLKTLYAFAKSQMGFEWFTIIYEDVEKSEKGN